MPYTDSVHTVALPIGKHSFAAHRLPRVRARLHPFRVLRNAAEKLMTPAKPVLVNLASIPLTVAGIGLIDVGVFYASTIAGFIITGITLIVLEHLAADE